VSQHSRSKSRPNEGVITGRGEENSLGHQIREHNQVVVPLAPVHLVGSHPNHGVETQRLIRRLHVGGELPPRPRVAFDEALAGPLHWHFTHQSYGGGLENLSEALAAAFPRHCHTVHLAVGATASPWLGTNDDALLVENVEVAPLHRLDMVVAGHPGPGARAFLRPQRGRLLDLQPEGRGACLKPSLRNTPCLTKPQQQSKRFLRCHRRSSSCGRQVPAPFPLEIARNLEIAYQLIS
jgi:hypothetical protein